MADRRMLWKNVCRSRKVNSLSDKAALLWTWAIPWFDRDGYIEAELDFIREMVFPKRNITEEEVKSILIEIFSSGLWIPYKNKEENKLIAFDPRFKKFQTIQYDREGKSDFKDKCSKITLDELLDESKSKGTLTKDKIEEGKLRLRLSLKESKEGECERKPNPDPIIDNSNSKGALKDEKPEKLTEPEKLELAILVEKIKDHYQSNFRPLLWLQNNQKLNPKTHLHVMKRISEEWPDFPKAYADKIAYIEDGNYNERETIEQHQQNKNVFTDLLYKLKQLEPMEK